MLHSLVRLGKTRLSSTKNAFHTQFIQGINTIINTWSIQSKPPLNLDWFLCRLKCRVLSVAQVHRAQNSKRTEDFRYCQNRIRKTTVAEDYRWRQENPTLRNCQSHHDSNLSFYLTTQTQLLSHVDEAITQIVCLTFASSMDLEERRCVTPVKLGIPNRCDWRLFKSWTLTANRFMSECFKTFAFAAQV